jgi:hypothetical protein
VISQTSKTIIESKREEGRRREMEMEKGRRDKGERKRKRKERKYFSHWVKIINESTNLGEQSSS